jgi:hypothetical protein
VPIGAYFLNGNRIEATQMTKPMTRFGTLVFLVCLLMTAPGTAFAAGSIVTVAFNGTGTGAYAGQSFTGTFSYEQSHKVSNIPGKFVFQGSPDTHSIYYKLGTGTAVSGSGGACDPFTILTSAAGDTSFQLSAATPAGTTVAITIPMNAHLNQTHLPYSTAFPVPPVATTTTFTVTNAGTVTFTGTITTVIPSEQ